MTETSTNTIPSLSDAEIQERVGAQSFQRGKQYFRDRAIFDMRQQGMTLKARSHGSSGGPYRLRVTFDPNGITDANCSCPVGGGGYCKHIAALLMTWRERPEEFAEVEDLEATLEQRSKEELVALVKQMLRQDPDLESLLEVPLPAAGRRSEPVDPEIYRRQAASAFYQAEESWKGSGDIIDSLLAITSIGDGFRRQGDYGNATVVYEGVVLETVKNFESYYDEDGSMMEVISTCVEGLGACLEHLEDAARREHLLHILWEIYRFDINFGGIGMSDVAIEYIFEQTTPEERHTIAGWVHEAMPQPSGNFTSNWRREAFGGFLLDLEQETLDDESYLQVCRESGRVNDLVDRLLSLGRVEEAVQATAQASDYGMLTLAGIFDRHEQGDLAEQLMEERAQTTQDTRVFDWLKDRYKLRGDIAAALELAEKLFRGRPDLTRYRELRELGTQTGRWEELRPQLLSFLSEQGWNDLRIAIYLDEGEIDLALETLRTHGSQVMGYSYGLYGGGSLALQVAKAAEKTRPYDALEIYGQQVERLIAGRNRGSYAEAARLLVKMRDIHEDLGESEAWDGYLQDLQNRYRTLRALKDEMGQAGLL